jgi:hypothetical protein
MPNKLQKLNIYNKIFQKLTFSKTFILYKLQNVNLKSIKINFTIAKFQLPQTKLLNPCY